MQNDGVGQIDIITVVKACQALSGAGAVSDLIKTLMRIVMQNGGARRAFLLLCHGPDCLVEAQAMVRGETEIEVVQQVFQPISSTLPLSMVNYVRRTQLSVILDDARQENLFSPDEYLTRENPLSVLCLPILKQQDVVGLLYLENDLVKGAFTADRLLVLELLAAQTVISLDNLRAAERFRGLLKSAPDAMVIVDNSGKICIVNTQLERLFGYRKEELHGKDIEMLIPARYHAKHVEHRAGYMRTPRFRPMGVGLDLYGRHKDGSEFPVDISLSPFATDEGLLVTASIRDITERKKAEEALKQSELKYRQLSETLELRVKETVAELRQKDQLLIVQGRQASMGEMINNIAHQWRQPLNILALLAQELNFTFQRGDFTREFIETNIQKTLNVVQHMSKTIDDFRDFYRPDKEKVPFRLVETVEKAVSLLEGTIKAAQIKIVISKSADPVVLGYPNEFSQALINILINARDAFLANKVDQPEIQIEVGSEQDKALLTITDNAGGIPEEIMDQIFLPYFTTKGPDKGTGVGLFMSKTIIEKNMNGSLTACNVEKGARFRIVV